jgi:hypothetical protein
MTQPFRLGSKSYGVGFATSISTASDPITFGSETGRYCVVTVMSVGGSSAVSITGVTIGGVAMTPMTERSMTTDGLQAGKNRAFKLVSDSIPVGQPLIEATASANTARLQMSVEWGHSATAVSDPVYSQTSGFTATVSVGTAGADDASSVQYFSDAASQTGSNPWTDPKATFAGVSGTTISGAYVPSAGTYHAYSLHKTGTGTVSLGVVVTGAHFTPVHWGYSYKVTGVASTAVAPGITTSPASQSITAGNTATMSVVATGTAPLTYQWYRGGAAISGATSASYTTGVLQLVDSGAVFSVVVANGTLPNATSANATVTVVAAPVAPSVTSQPAAATVSAGATASFTAAFAGTAPMTYQWFRNAVAISGATALTLNVNTVLGDNGALFTCQATNSVNSILTNTALLTVTAGATYGAVFAAGALVNMTGSAKHLSQPWTGYAIPWNPATPSGAATATRTPISGTTAADGTLTVSGLPAAGTFMARVFFGSGSTVSAHTFVGVGA